MQDLELKVNVAAQELKHAAVDLASEGVSIAKGGAEVLSKRSAEIARACEQGIQRHPLLAVAVAAGAGAFLARTLSRMGAQESRS